MSHVKVSLDAVLNQDGSVSCELVCKHQRATVIFTGTDVLLDVPESSAAHGIETPAGEEEQAFVIPPPNTAQPDHSWPDLTPRQ